MVRTAIEMLQRHAGGYLLVVDAGLIERASLANNGEHALKELLELDQAVSVALQYAGTKTLVLVAGGEATGGMALNGYPLHGDHGVSLLGMNAEGPAFHYLGNRARWHGTRRRFGVAADRAGRVLLAVCRERGRRRNRWRVRSWLRTGPGVSGQYVPLRAGEIRALIEPCQARRAKLPSGCVPPADVPAPSPRRPPVATSAGTIAVVSLLFNVVLGGWIWHIQTFASVPVEPAGDLRRQRRPLAGRIRFAAPGASGDQAGADRLASRGLEQS